MNIKNLNSTSTKNLILLSLSQAIFVSATIISFTFAGLVGKVLAANPENATMPIVFTSLGTLLAIYPASILMKKISRKFGFMLGTLLGISCGIFSFVSIQLNSFILFCFSCACMGLYQAFAQYLRFAATEVVSNKYASKAISIVLVGGVIGAIVGPELGVLSAKIFPLKNYAQAYLAVAIISFIGFLVSLFLKIPKPEVVTDIKKEAPKSIAVLMKERNFFIAMTNIAVGYFLMILLMTATPLAMTGMDYKINDVNYIIQWHLLGMYLPSFFTGNLIYKYGTRNIFFIGIVLLSISCFAVYAGSSFGAFTIALITVGIGWNFMYISGSTLLASICNPREKAIIQGVNEVTIFLISALASYLSGVLLHVIGWHSMSLCAVPFIILTIVMTFGLQRKTSSNLAEDKI